MREGGKRGWGALLHHMAVATALAAGLIAGCGGSDEAEPAPTTVGELFAGSTATTTVEGPAVPGWKHRELPEMRTALEACVALVDVRSSTAGDEEGSRTVIVESGDSLGKIAARFDRTVDQFMKANGISDPNLLQVGQVLVVPAQRIETELEVEGPTVLIEPVYCEVDTGVTAFGPDGVQIGGPGIIEVFADWKRLEGPDEAPRINGRLRGLVQASVGSFVADVADEVERFGFACRDGSHARCAWLQHRPEVLLATEDLFSVRDVVRRLMPGASAVDEEIRTETFDVATGRPITVAELFDPMTDWVAAV